MAEAKKCDICGGLYEMYNCKIPTKYPNYIELNSESVSGSVRGITHYDCCPDCMYQIGALIYDLQNPGKDETDFMKKKFNLPLEEVNESN